jgi:hypothetical protein
LDVLVSLNSKNYNLGLGLGGMRASPENIEIFVLGKAGSFIFWELLLRLSTVLVFHLLSKPQNLLFDHLLEDFLETVVVL